MTTSKRTKPEPPKPGLKFPPRQILHSEQDFRDWLKELGSLNPKAAIAEHVGIRPTQFSHLLSGRAPIGNLMASRFGFERVDSVSFIPRPEGGKKG